MKNQNRSSHSNCPSLTPKEKMVLEFIEEFIFEQGIAPSFREIKDHFGFASFFSVQRYLKQLQEKGYIALAGNNQKRGIELINTSHSFSETAKPSLSEQGAGSSGSLNLPLLGKVAAGQPIEHKESNEYFEVPPSMVKKADSTYVLKVQGDSMIEDGIFDGDFLLIQKQNTAQQGDTIVALVENEATVKHFYNHKNKSAKLNSTYKDKVQRGLSIELRPANMSMESMFYHPKDVSIEGIVVGLIRKM